MDNEHRVRGLSIVLGVLDNGTHPPVRVVPKLNSPILREKFVEVV